MSIDIIPIESVSTADFTALVDNQVREGKTIEYKSELPGRTDSAKKEFLADVSCLANASGGHLLFGIEERNGVATNLPGVLISDVDGEKLRLENLMRDGIEPRIPGVLVHPVSLSDSSFIMMVRVPRSWIQPHRVIYKGHGHFYSRNSAGKFPLDVSELRYAFTMSDTPLSRIQEFSDKRLGMIASGQTPVPLHRTAKSVLHMIPFSASDPSHQFDIARIVNGNANLQPLSAASWYDRYNLDGYLTHRSEPNRSTYLQTFRNGSIEAVEEWLPIETEDKSIPSVAFEKGLAHDLSRFLSTQRALGVEPPILVMLSLLGVTGYSMQTNAPWPANYQMLKIDRDFLQIQALEVRSFDEEPFDILKPAFDSVWNACGWPRSQNYDEKGKWVGGR